MTISRKENAEVEMNSWGQLTWHASKALGNSDKITLGECRIKPGMENPRHMHPNCEETLRVDRGRIIHTYGDHELEMEPGDAITIPEGELHNARNIGVEECILTIVFTSSVRETVGE